MLKIVFGHPLSREPLLKTVANPSTVKIPQPPDRLSGLLLPVDNQSGHALIDNFRHRARSKRDYWCAAGHRFDHHQTEGLRPINRKQQSRRAGEKLLFGFIIDFASKTDLIAINLRFKLFLEIAPFGTWYFGCDTKRHLRCARDSNGSIGSFFGS